MTLTKTELSILKKEMPYGMETIIAKELGCTPSWISKQLLGVAPMTEKSYNAITKKIKELKQDKQNRLKKLIKTLA